MGLVKFQHKVNLARLSLSLGAINKIGQEV